MKNVSTPSTSTARLLPTADWGRVQWDWKLPVADIRGDLTTSALSHSISEEYLRDIFQLVSLPSVPQLLSTLHLESQMRAGHQLLAVHCLEEKAQVLPHSI